MIGTAHFVLTLAQITALLNRIDAEFVKPIFPQPIRQPKLTYSSVDAAFCSLVLLPRPRALQTLGFFTYNADCRPSLGVADARKF